MSKPSSKPVHDVRTTLYGHCYDVKTLKRRRNNIVLTPWACWELLIGRFLSFIKVECFRKVFCGQSKFFFVFIKFFFHLNICFRPEKQFSVQSLVRRKFSGIWIFTLIRSKCSINRLVQKCDFWWNSTNFFIFSLWISPWYQIINPLNLKKSVFHFARRLLTELQCKVNYYYKN